MCLCMRLCMSVCVCVCVCVSVCITGESAKQGVKKVAKWIQTTAAHEKLCR
jgi:outer membrane lipoprotein-sorting protein